MNNSWEKYFKPAYSPLKATKEPAKELFFFCVLGFIIAFGLMLSVSETGKSSSSFLAKPSLVKKLEEFEEKNSILESDVLILNNNFAKAIENKTKKFLEKFNNLLAIEDITGEGVIITLDDSSAPLDPKVNPNLVVIHNIDLLSVVNELWSAGAVAVSVNGQRITAKSEFRCTGSIVQLNNTRILPPFVIKAIGKPNKLQSTVAKGYIKKYRLEDYGIKVTVIKSDNVTVNASGDVLVNSIKGLK